MSSDSELASVEGLCPGFVRKISQFFETQSNNTDVVTVKMRLQPAVTIQNRRKALSLLMDSYLKMNSDIDKKSENFRADQVRSIFSLFSAINGAQMPPCVIDRTSETKSVDPSVIFNFSFLKKLFMHTFSTSASFLTKSPTLQIENSPEKAMCRYAKLLVMRKPEVAVKTGLASQKLNQNGVPIVVEKCIDFIVQYGLRSEGIYRVNGSNDKINKLMLRFKKSPEELNIKYPKYDEFDVASALKGFIRELPKSLLCNLSDDFIKTSQIKCASQKKVAYRDLLEKLPMAEYKTLRKIFDHLREIESFADDNKMSACSLATVWAQTLMICDTANYALCNKAIEDLIQHFSDMFIVALPSDETTERKKFVTSLKQKGEFKVWIKLVTEKETKAAADDGHYIVTALAANKSCKDVLEQHQISAVDATMVEVLLNGTLKRPMHPYEVVKESVLRWGKFSATERESNHFVVTPTKFYYHTEMLSNLKTTFSVNYMNSFGVSKLTHYTVIIEDDGTLLLVGQSNNQMQRLKIQLLNAYLGAVANIYGVDVKNAITLIEFDEIDKNFGDPLKTHMLASHNDEIQMILYLSITHNSHAELDHNYRNSIQPN